MVIAGHAGYVGTAGNAGCWIIMQMVQVQQKMQGMQVLQESWLEKPPLRRCNGSEGRHRPRKKGPLAHDSERDLLALSRLLMSG
jgi:hypothetical protein